MNSHIFVTQTPGGNIKYECMVKTISSDELLHLEDKQRFDYLCKTGCINYNMKWSCPPFAPAYSSIVRSYKYILIVLLKVQLAQFSYIKNNYLKIKAANSILKSRLDRALRITKKCNEFYISTGSCRLCKPCKRKMGEPCALPVERAYSFEALGINVSALTLDVFHTELLWYQKGIVPQYTCVVGGLVTNGEISIAELYGNLTNKDNVKGEIEAQVVK